MLTAHALHSLLGTTFGLVTDPSERGSGRTYFLPPITWQPPRSTRILHVRTDAAGHVAQVRLCISSDNNNSVFAPQPVQWQTLRPLVAAEIAQYRDYAARAGRC
ncbi:hypothetical protein CMPELA_10470 [Cupriavidus necator]|uniref:Uncharacterized protein n=1 Tax=Cupriavidus necator (strain ATCC 17699 / DSM 428 / KCTC 22496 / NCIMB 10442 / H16 / Stanier 337) TaxID=381666 RepID=A0AAE5ZGR6_CUPNH|nr:MULTISPECIES: hypothetical protein [Cupriavidus]EON16616.1 hypothetical protein C265_26793 [Cupriavidus sp. GA3-3]KUE86897.1 hypothetical protein ASL20_20640 [Cupriavidus necator]QCC00995.1 hypothetical protein E6A55_10615 [Cupriavidus necator H16]QQB76178.1 hypothetical protein I6H87_15530 [Cupriavidus necator]WKA39365.1 hypothetical protein QWP09_10610 [Cupriavidus necator]